MALQQLQVQTSTPLTLVHTDHGSQFQGKLREILPGVKITCSHRLSQRTNYVENRIRLSKAVARKIFQRTSKEPLDAKIDLFNIQIIILIIENCINSLPYNNKSGTSGVTPDHFLHPFLFIKQTLNGDSDDEEHNIEVEQKVKNYFRKIIEIRNKEILTEERRFRQQYGTHGPYEIKVDDIVYVKNSDFARIKIGKVMKISKNGTSVTVRFGGKRTKIYNVQDLHPLVYSL